MISTIKQYGEIRTGTNYLRALIQRNYPEIQVLTYILGSKHLPPVDFEALWAEAQQSGGAAAFDFVATATYSRRGGASHPKDPTQAAELTRRAPGIASAFATGGLGFLVTIKEPYAWVVSAARFNGWLKDEEEQMGDWCLELLREACLGYNRNYRIWLDLVRSQGSRARLVRYEELLAAPERVLADIACQFGWQQVKSFEAIPAVIEPTQWDHLPVEEAAMQFKPEYYTSGTYLERLSDKHLRLIDQLMDWELLRDLGYKRR